MSSGPMAVLALHIVATYLPLVTHNKIKDLWRTWNARQITTWDKRAISRWIVVEGQYSDGVQREILFSNSMAGSVRIVTIFCLSNFLLMCYFGWKKCLFFSLVVCQLFSLLFMYICERYQTNGYKYSNQTLTILFDINHLFAHSSMVSSIDI